jgi:hypothetical protein
LQEKLRDPRVDGSAAEGTGGFANAAGWLQRFDTNFHFLAKNSDTRRRNEGNFFVPRTNLLLKDGYVVFRILFSFWIAAVRKIASTS